MVGYHSTRLATMDTQVSNHTLLHNRDIHIHVDNLTQCIKITLLGVSEPPYRLLHV